MHLQLSVPFYQALERSPVILMPRGAIEKTVWKEILRYDPGVRCPIQAWLGSECWFPDVSAIWGGGGLGLWQDQGNPGAGLGR